MPPLHTLRAFEAAARLGRMTAAAESLSVTPGAISKQIKQLENFLGVKLFAGSKNKPSLTAEGARLQSYLVEGFKQIQSGIQALQQSPQTVLTISVLNTFAMRWLIPRLYRFNQQHPQLDIRLSPQMEPDSAIKGHDLLIGVEANTPSRGDAVTVLFKEHLGPVLSPELLAHSPIHTLKDLKAVPLIQTRTRSNAWHMWLQAQGKKAAMQDGPVFDHYYFSIEAAVGGLGACVVPLHLVSEDLLAKRLIAPLGFVESGYVYVAKSLNPHHPFVALFLEWLCAEASVWTSQVASIVA